MVKKTETIEVKIYAFLRSQAMEQFEGLSGEKTTFKLEHLTPSPSLSIYEPALEMRQPASSTLKWVSLVNTSEGTEMTINPVSLPAGVYTVTVETYDNLVVDSPTIMTETVTVEVLPNIIGSGTITFVTDLPRLTVLKIGLKGTIILPPMKPGAEALKEIILETDPVLRSFVNVSTETRSIDYDLTSTQSKTLVAGDYSILLTLLDTKYKSSEIVNKLVVRV